MMKMELTDSRSDYNTKDYSNDDSCLTVTKTLQKIPEFPIWLKFLHNSSTQNYEFSSEPIYTHEKLTTPGKPRVKPRDPF